MVPVGAEFKPGDIVGNTYEVIDYIGRGAMGYVYHVRHSGLPREYALKTLSTDQITETAWLRFQIEAQSIAKMSHPNIITIHNFALHKAAGRVDQPFYVMDLLVGTSLMEELRDNDALPLAQALSVFIQAANGIGYAHGKGIIHRDIKPGNIMLLKQPDASGASVKIVDFGIAKLTADSDLVQQHLTSAGEVFGSPFYMSPEQGLGKPVDARSDVYSLGISLFEALTGDLPFKANSAVDIMLMHQSTPVPSLSSACAVVFPESIEHVVRHMLAKEPSQRYQSMQEVVADLAAVAGGEPLPSCRALVVDGNNDEQDSSRPTNSSRLSANAYTDGVLSAPADEADMEQSETAQAQLPKTLVVLLTVSFFIAVASAAAFIATRTSHQNEADGSSIGRQVKSSAKSAGSSAAGPAKGTGTAGGITSAIKVTGSNETKQKPKLDPEEDKEPGASLKSTKPFGILGQDKGGLMVDFDFPTDVLIGYIHCWDGAGRETTVKAKGRLHYGSDTWISFQPSRIIGKYPQYLKRFQADELSAVELVENSNSDAILEACTAIPGINYLIIGEAHNLTAKCIPSLNKFKGLQTFDCTNGTLDGFALARATCWDEIEEFIAGNVRNITPMLLKLKSCKSLKTLDVHGSNLTYQDYKIISELPHLTYLKFQGDAITLNELKVLASAPKLETIELYDCGLNDRAIPILRQFKTLKELKMGSEKTPVKVRDKFKAALPGLSVQ